MYGLCVTGQQGHYCSAMRSAGAISKILKKETTVSKRKRHNPVKRLITQSKLAVSDLALSLRQSEVDAGEPGIQCRKYLSGRPVNIGKSVAEALNRTAFRWAVLLIVWSEESNGKTRVVTEWIRFASDYHQADLNDWLKNQHDIMILAEADRGNWFIDCGWVGLPVPPAYVDDETDELLKANLLRLME